MNYPLNNLLHDCIYILQNEDKTPHFVYHYTKFENAKEILNSGRLYMQPLEKQNDPWEFLTRENIGVVGADETFEESRKNLEKHNHAIDERKNYVRQASFSASVEGKHGWRYGWNLTRMWAQYADNHAGVCLIFNYKQLCNDFDAAFVDKHFSRPIKYVGLDELDELESKYWNATETFLDDAHIDLLFTKHDDFEHEQEYRFLAVNRGLGISDENPYLPIRNSFCGLITGKRFGKGVDKKGLREAMNQCNKDSRLLEMNPNQFSLPLYDPEHLKRLLAEI